MSQQSEQLSFLPENMAILTLEKFEGLNTKATRNGIKDQQMFVCDGFMPLGDNNLRTIPDIGTPMFDIGTNTNVFWFAFGNIGIVPYGIVVGTNGSLFAFRTDTGATTELGGPGTISGSVIANGTSQIGLTQWGQQFLVIVAGQTNGFFIWDGTNFFEAGTLGPDVDLFQAGEGYVSQPTMSLIGASGTGQSFEATLFNNEIVGITVTNPGIGFNINDQPILQFSGGGSSGVTGHLIPIINGGGTVTSVSIFFGGHGYQQPVGTFLDNFGVGANISITATNGSISSVSVIAGGSGYSSFTQILIEDPDSPVAVATVDLFPTGVQGSCAQVYTARLFIGSGPLMQISAPGSLVAFDAADGGDEFTSVDSFLRVAWVALQQSNGFIYLIADSSVNYISGIQTAGSPLATTFSNQNADPENGTPWQPSAGTLGESIIFANSIGVQLGYGGRFTKISEPLDGIYFTGINGTAQFVPSAGKSVIFGRKVWSLLYNIDTLEFGNTNRLLMTDGKIWWTSSQSVKLTFIAGQEINSNLTTWGTDDRFIYPLFQNPSTNFPKVVQTKFWSQPNGYASNKTADRVWGAAEWNNFTNVTGLNIAVESENTDGQAPVFNFLPNPAGLGITVFPPTACSVSGTLLGMTISTFDADVTLISASISASVDNYRG